MPNMPAVPAVMGGLRIVCGSLTDLTYMVKATIPSRRFDCGAT